MSNRRPEDAGSWRDRKRRPSPEEGQEVASSVQEALAGLLPAARRAPQLPVFDAVNLPALLGLAADPPAGGAVMLQPLLSHADRSRPERRALSAAGGGRGRQTTRGGRCGRHHVTQGRSLVGVL